MRRVSIFAWLTLVPFTAALGVGVASATSSCAGEENEGAADAVSESPRLGEGGPPEAAAEPPLGEPCGDRRGLAPNAPWPMRGGCPKRAGYFTGAGPGSATLKWSIPVASSLSSPAVSAGGVVWFGTEAGDIVAASSGALLAVLSTGAAIQSSPVLRADGTVVIGGGDGKIHALRLPSTPSPGDAGDDASDAGDAGDGRAPAADEVFAIAVGPIASSPAVAGDGTIYVTTTDGKLHAVAADGASTKWVFATNDTAGSSPSIGASGTVYVGSSDGNLYAVNPDGSLRWKYGARGPVSGSPAVGGDDVIYVGDATGALHAVDPAGQPRWSYATGGAIDGTPAVRAGLVYVGSQDKKVHAVTTTKGELRWAYETGAPVGSPVVTKDGTVYVGSADGRLYVLTPTGSLYFAVNTKGQVKGAPAIGSGGVLYVTTTGSIVAIGP